MGNFLTEFYPQVDELGVVIRSRLESLTSMGFIATALGGLAPGLVGTINNSTGLAASGLLTFAVSYGGVLKMDNVWRTRAEPSEVLK